MKNQPEQTYTNRAASSPVILPNLTAGYAELCRRINGNIHKPPVAVKTNSSGGDDLKLNALLSQGQEYSIFSATGATSNEYQC